MIIRADIKQAAKGQLKGYVGTYFLSYLVSGIVTAIVYVIHGIGGYIRLGEFQFLMSVLTLIASAVSIIAIPAFDIGIIRIGLNLYYGKHAKVSNVFEGFRSPGRIIWLNIITSFFKFCWTLIPLAGFVLGVIKTYSYAMAPYILADNPEMTARNALSESKKIMHGHKMDLFIMDLSFIGWYFLVAFTLGIAGIYVYPYKSLCYVNFYKAVSGGRKELSDYSSERHCIHCGRKLHGDEICTCKTPMIESSEPTRVCIHCGKTLYADEKCNCKIAEKPRVRSTLKDTMRKPTEEKLFCNKCGKTLLDDEICSCEQKIMLKHDSVSDKREVSPVSEINSAMFSGGLKSTMRGKDKPVDYRELSNKEEGKKFLNKAEDLD